MSYTAPAATAEPTAPAAPANPTPAAPTPTPTPPATPAPAATQQQPAPAENTEPWNDPEAAKAEIEKLRKENGDQRINAKNAARDEGKTAATQDIAKALLGVLGVELPGDKPATPEQLAEQVGAVTTERDTARFDAAVAQAAWQAGVDPERADYLAFKLSKSADLAGVDPTSPEFGDKLKASITSLMAEDATLKRSGTATASGVENLAGSGGSDTITPEKFAQMSITERTNLYKTDRATYDKLTGNS